ncbi:hypothetical protein GQX73_g7326 [Xylaria multiplex]|uniref:AA1-like domain-containing protein n=1 Tax=Xylaria multiplex TaxID=323545 RepID=A0A7C8IPA6_9PEZI|nr:hypothetical protein GQX73_g7326 [Xylaria multiplex]
MQYLVLLTSLLLGATATLVEQRQTSPQAQVSSFSAHTNLYDNGFSIGYDFEITGLVNTHCNYSDTTSGPTVPRVDLIDCEDPTVRWQFFHEPAPMGAPYRIVIIYTPATGAETYSQALQETDFPEVTFISIPKNGSVYVGEPKFDVYRVSD